MLLDEEQIIVQHEGINLYITIKSVTEWLNERLPDKTVRKKGAIEWPARWPYIDIFRSACKNVFKREPPNIDDLSRWIEEYEQMQI